MILNSARVTGTGALSAVVLAVLTLATANSVWAQPPSSALESIPAIGPPPLDKLRTEIQAWLDAAKTGKAERQKVEALWSRPEVAENATLRLAALAETFAIADPRAAALVDHCKSPESSRVSLDVAWLADEETPAFERNNLRLYFAQWLAHQQLYDELLAQLTGIEPTAVVDPAALLFYRAIAYHRLLQPEPGLADTTQLLTGVADVPQRYLALAGLMEEDLRSLKEDSLDHVSRRMDDIRRRLELGRAGTKVREVEDGVIASLDKLIEELEDQQGQSGTSGAGMRPTAPMQDSNIARANAPGNVQRANIGSKSGWGDLPPKQREEAMQAVSRTFPSHYRRAIEQYFRKLAEGEEGSNATQEEEP